MPPSHRALALPFLALLAGCGDKVDFKLTVEPIFAENQKEAIRAVSKWRMVLEYPTANPDTFDLDFGRADYANVKDLPSLPEGTTIAVEGLEADGETLVAFGRTQPLSVEDHGEVKVQVLVALVDSFFTLNNDVALWGAALAPSGAGDFFAFGGNSKGLGWSGSPTDAIFQLKVASPDSGELGFVEVATLPPTTDGLEGRLHASATLLAEGNHAHTGQILVMGGWSSYLNSEATWEAFYFDPVSLESEPVTDPGGALAGLYYARAGHRAVELPGGKVVVFGGFANGNGTTSAPEIFDPGTGISEKTESIPFAATLGDAAVLGDRGAIYCGGMDDYDDSWSSTNLCVIVNSAGGIANEYLPDAIPSLLMPALAPLSGNRVLLTGGFESVSGDYRGDFSRTETATDMAWIYAADGGGTWTEVESMTQRRGNHRAVTLPDGRVLVVGGAPEMGSLSTGPLTALACAEIFDPEDGPTGSWTPIGTCDADAGQGVLPGTMADPTGAVDPNYGAVFLGGVNSEADAVAHATLYIGPPGW